MTSRPLRVLFLCTGNSCRSQMAEGWARALKPNAIVAESAGTSPSSLNPRAVRAMLEAGVDISSQRSKHIDSLDRGWFDFIVTVCDSAHDACPVFLGAPRVVHVGFDDPPRLAHGAHSDEEAMSHYRRVRDEIKSFVQTLPESLLPRETAPSKDPPMTTTPSDIPSAVRATVRVFDPPMCCSSGVCGAEPNIALARFAADLRWLQAQGVVVERFSLSQQPEAFAADPLIMQTVRTRGSDVLPIVMISGQVVAEREYPSREELAGRLGLAIAASKPGGCGCGPCGCC